MDVVTSILLGALLGFLIGLAPTREVLHRGREAVVKRTLERLLAPDRMTSAEEDPYFNREFAKPER